MARSSVSMVDVQGSKIRKNRSNFAIFGFKKISCRTVAARDLKFLTDDRNRNTKKRRK